MGVDEGRGKFAGREGGVVEPGAPEVPARPVRAGDPLTEFATAVVIEHWLAAA